MLRAKPSPPSEPKKSRQLAISQRQARTLLRAAEQEKGIVEVETGDLVYRLIPKSLADGRAQGNRIHTSQKFASLDEYRAWKERTVADKD